MSWKKKRETFIGLEGQGEGQGALIASSSGEGEEHVGSGNYLLAEKGGRDVLLI